MYVLVISAREKIGEESKVKEMWVSKERWVAVLFKDMLGRLLCDSNI